MKNVTESQFNEAVLLPSFQQPVLVMFHAAWCGPCKSVKPIIERLSDSFGFGVIGVDAGEERALASFWGVRGVPTIAVFKEGKLVAQKSGTQSEPVIRSFLTEQGIIAAGALEF